ncbi:hypothetical protein [Pseudonocardia sp. KRD291]|uniref:hypothetical protein n=1 Tax=Pseudonocardia sp. KRD291 TaxID=2792007 RepID=UPI001C4A1095|nr:hypothetical protein [Pseudonocardia sp. KRD291]MBW0104209.1 hypothetical protein [Pseudonocardia sp. KRD291]
MTSETRNTGPGRGAASASSTRTAESTQYLDPNRSASPVDQPTTAVRPPSPHPQGEPSDTPRPPTPAPRDAGPLSPLWVWGSPVLAVLAVVMLPLAAATTNLDDLGGWGLAAVLSPFGWAALVLAIAACVVELWSKRPRIPMLGIATTVLILCSFGMPSVVMPQARFTTAWLIGGFVDALAGTGVPPTGVDARFYWPAFFAQWAWFRDAAGVDNLDVVLRWFPAAVVAVWAIGVYALARSMLGGTRAPWVAAWLFLGLNWIEQDYFSPQATGIVLLLTVLTFALGPLATRRTDTAGVAGWPRPHPGSPRLPRWRRWLVSAMTPPNSPTLPPRQLLLIYFSAALCLLAIAPTHQLTPFAIIGQLVVLAVVGRFRGRGLVIVATLGVGIYILIAGRDFWMTQISMITGGGDEGGAIEAGFFERLEGDTGQIVVKLLRALMPVLTWLLAIVGAWVYWKRRRDLVPILLAVVPMGMAAVQSYGGELLLRVILYGLPVLTILAVDALRAFVRADRRREIALGIGMLILFPVLLLIRGGNDAYMDVTTEDVAMTRQAYDQAPPGALVQPLSNVGPYGLEGIGEHNRAPGVEGCTQIANDPLRCIDQMQPQTLLFYESIEKEGVVLNGEQPGWSTRIRDQLIASGQYRATYQNGFNAVLVRVVAPQ